MDLFWICTGLFLLALVGLWLWIRQRGKKRPDETDSEWLDRQW